MPDLATLIARAAVLAALGWFMYVGLCIVVQGIGPASLEPVEDEEEFVGADDPCDEWDRAHDRWTDEQLGVA